MSSQALQEALAARDEAIGGSDNVAKDAESEASKQEGRVAMAEEKLTG